MRSERSSWRPRAAERVAPGRRHSKVGVWRRVADAFAIKEVRLGRQQRGATHGGGGGGAGASAVVSAPRHLTNLTWIY